jgi:hypothetical protein
MGRVIVGGIVGGALLFVWGFVAHMVLPLWHDALRFVPAEDSVLGAMKEAIPEPGVYLLPGVDMSREMSEDDKKALEAKLLAGPRAFLVFNREGAEMPPTLKQLGLEAASNILGALLAAVILFALRAGFLARLLASTLFGVMGWLAISFSYWNWFSFSWEFTRAELIDQTCGWFIVGIALAIIVRPRPGPSPPPP